MTAEEIANDYARRTADDVGEGQLIRAACRRYLNDLKRDDITLNWRAVDRFLAFVGRLHHTTGRHAGRPIVLEPWQVWIVANILGWEYTLTHRRRFIASYIEVARKNGKTMLAACLCVYFFIADGEAAAEVDLAANSREQASIALQYCKDLCEQIDPTLKLLKQYRTSIKYLRKKAVLNCFAADSTKLDGYNASFALIDEYHAAPTSLVRDVLKSSQGMRADPHICTITTAGFSRDCPCYQLRSSCAEVVDGIKDDDRLFAAIYSPDAGDDWTEPATWRKGSPNLGVTVSEEYIKAQVTTARVNPSEEINVRTKNLNEWTDVSDVWLPDADLRECWHKVEIPDGATVYVGVDLAAVGDLTAVSYMTMQDGQYWWRTDYYLPRAAMETGKQAYNYSLWAAAGHLHITDGNVTDYDLITADIMAASQRWMIACVAYDAWNSTQWAIDATAKGLPLQPYSQSIGNFSGVTRTLEREVRCHRAVIDSNDVTAFCFSNVIIKTDSNGNIKPTKAARANKIDGVISMLMALGGYVKQGGQQVTANIFVI